MEPEKRVKTDLEDHFILRLPKVEATKVHSVLQTKPEKIKKLLKINLDPEKRQATVHVGRTKLRGVLKKLPTITESYKTNICNNKSTLFKTADICQMLQCYSSNEEVDENLEYPHGLTPPLKNVKKNRFRKTLINTDQAVEVEGVVKELFYLLRTDLEAQSNNFD